MKTDKVLRKRFNIPKEEASILYKRSKGEKVIYVIAFTIFAVYALSLIFPFLWLLVNSFQNKIIYQINMSDGNAFALPKRWELANYIYAFKELSYNGSNIFNMFFNSIWYTGIHIGGGILMSSFTGYCLSKYDFKVKNLMHAIIIFSMTIPIVGTAGATFKLMSDLNIYNTPFYVLFTSLSGIGLNFLIMYGFFKNISWSYAEAAFIDGASHFTVFFKIMLPMAKPIIFTLSIMSGITYWNEYMNVLLYLPDFPTIASGLFSVSRTLPRLGNTPAYFAALVISLLPVLVIFSLFSDVIMKNFTVGGLKG